MRTTLVLVFTTILTACATDGAGTLRGDERALATTTSDEPLAEPLTCPVKYPLEAFSACQVTRASSYVEEAVFCDRVGAKWQQVTRCSFGFGCGPAANCVDSTNGDDDHCTADLDLGPRIVPVFRPDSEPELGFDTREACLEAIGRSKDLGYWDRKARAACARRSQEIRETEAPCGEAPQCCAAG